MSKEVKFRFLIEDEIWTEDEIQKDGEMYIEYMYGKGPVVMCYVEDGYSGRYDEVSTNRDQYTGLKDKDGVEMYESDIVKSDFYEPEIKCLAAISYSNEDAKYCFVNGSGDLNGEQDAFKYGNLTVIGNIHQNPELLD